MSIKCPDCGHAISAHKAAHGGKCGFYECRNPVQKPRKAIKPRSEKMIQLASDNKDWRDDFKRLFTHCMVCGQFVPYDARTVDEITPGTNRLKGFVTREACLMACWNCNSGQTPGMPLAERLVFKLRADPFWFSLDAIRKIRDNGRHPEVVNMGDVRDAAERMGFLETT